jgi:hypothetical protein
MGEADNTFEPEEAPEAVDAPQPGSDPDAAGGTLTYEEEASASLQAMGEEPPQELSYDDESFARQEAATTPDELREVDLEDDLDDDEGVPI